jgi:hypothetical protein
MRTGWTSGIVAAALLTAFAGTARAQVAEQWVELGCQRVAFQTDRDVLRVGRRDGFFRAIRLRARGNNVYMLDLKVVYGNGQPDDIPVRAEIRAGGSSGKLDLRGLDRVIDRVVMVYRSQPNFRGQASICVDGLAVVAAAPPPPPPVVVMPPPPAVPLQWVLLGCARVAFRVDHDVLRVGQQAGMFRAIRLLVRGNDIFMRDLRVVYGNGAPDDLPVRAQIRAGGSSGAIDLKGARRFINRIEMVYQSRPDFRGQAEVCIEGVR